jgi:biopolymer transport protein ExbD
MRFRRPHEEEPELNLIPLIDVMLIVLIFLAVTTTYSRFTELQIELPTADAEKSPARPLEIQVAVTADGRFAVNRVVQPLADAQGLAEVLKRSTQERSDAVIVINADALAPHQSVVTVMEAARLAGIAHLSFAAQRRTPGP